MHTNWPAIAMALVIGTAPAMAQTTQATPPGPSSAGQTKELIPETEHTGWATLIHDTGRDFASFPRRTSTWVLLAGGAAAALAAHPADDYVQSHIVGNTTAERIFKPGQIIGSAGFQAGTALGLWAVGRYVVPSEGESRTNKISHLGFDLLRAQIVTQTLVQTIKVVAQRDRPTGECCAFPSGHAASAFAAASVLERHFGYRASWVALTGASYVATSRLVHNRHFLSDVIFGAALGEAVGWTVVGRHGRSEYAFEPVPVEGGMMIALVRTAD
ncbi:MAG: phosphatase PAP2 family protein [Acidobacteria bacterium]|nr:phosphatase PAP2 family protein [Acidobacteriota bacterium]